MIIPNDVLDRPEAHQRILHGAAEVAERRLGQRAEDEVEQQPEQHLQIERAQEDLADPIVARQPGAP